MTKAPRMCTQEVTILLAEDDSGHALLIEKNLRRANVTNPIIAVADGQTALDYLFGEGERAKEGPLRPALLILDLNMPVLDGYQVLARIKADKRTRRIPVVVLTSTDDSREVSRCYRLGCSVYVRKPVNYSDFSDAVQKLGLFLSVVTLSNGS